MANKWANTPLYQILSFDEEGKPTTPILEVYFDGRCTYRGEEIGRTNPIRNRIYEFVLDCISESGKKPAIQASPDSLGLEHGVPTRSTAWLIIHQKVGSFGVRNAGG